MTKEELLKEVTERLIKISNENPIDYSIDSDIVSSKDYKVDLNFASTINFPEMGRGIVRCILHRNNLDWINYE